MWVKTEKNTYLNLDNGQALAVTPAKHGGEWRVVNRSADGVSVLYAIQAGYRSEEKAQDALDELMDSADTKVVSITPPTEEDDDEEDEDDKE